MSALLEKIPCPRCSFPSAEHHCRTLSNCTWRVCRVCPAEKNLRLYFTKKGQWIIARE